MDEKARTGPAKKGQARSPSEPDAVFLVNPRDSFMQHGGNVMDLKGLERKRAALDEKIRQARAIEQKKAKFAAMVVRVRPELLDLDEEAIKGLIIPARSETQQAGGINE